MISFVKIINGFRIRFFRSSFCIGIGLDQITPVYYKYRTYQKIGSLKQEIVNYKKEQEAKNRKENSKSLQTKNYKPRSKNKY